jgi:uncharacterized sulfatase
MSAWRTWLVIVLAAVLGPEASRAADAPARSNVVIILADDMGAGELGCYGHPRFKTPNLDRMAAEGVRLTQFNTPMPFCAPTRAALMTGRYPFHHGLTANPTPDATPQADALGLALGERTLAELFKQAGYATGMVGKWHLGHKQPEFLPTRRGFNEYLGIPYSNDMRPVHLLDGENVVEYPVVQATLTRRYTERALRFFEQNRDHPFFFYFAHAMPHKPIACSEAFYGKSGAGLYGDVLAELDWSVGQVLARLKSLGLDDRTLVLFTSDNGAFYGGSTGGLRGMKATTWEGGFRVPMIARWPGRLPAGKFSDAPAVTPDLFATALAAAGLALPDDRPIDGTDLLPLLSGKTESAHNVVFGHQGPRIATVRDVRWKLHVLPARDLRLAAPGERWLDPRAPDGVTILAPYEQHQPTDYPGLRTGDETPAMSLFDLAADPGEQHNVAAAHPDVVSRLKAQYDQVVSALPENSPARAAAANP